MVFSEQGTGPAPVLDNGALGELRARLRGPLVLPHDADYDAVRRVFIAMIDRRPAAMARCAGTDDVVAAVDSARRSGVAVSVRGGGHGVRATASARPA